MPWSYRPVGIIVGSGVAAGERDTQVSSGMTLLFYARCPSTVPRFVVAVVIDAIYRVVR